MYEMKLGEEVLHVVKSSQMKFIFDSKEKAQKFMNERNVFQYVDSVCVLNYLDEAVRKIS